MQLSVSRWQSPFSILFDLIWKSDLPLSFHSEKGNLSLARLVEHFSRTLMSENPYGIGGSLSPFFAFFLFLQQMTPITTRMRMIAKMHPTTIPATIAVDRPAVVVVSVFLMPSTKTNISAVGHAKSFEIRYEDVKLNGIFRASSMNT